MASQAGREDVAACLACEALRVKQCFTRWKEIARQKQRSSERRWLPPEPLHPGMGPDSGFSETGGKFHKMS